MTSHNNPLIAWVSQRNFPKNAPLPTIRKVMFISGVNVLENTTNRWSKFRVLYQKLCPILWLLLLTHSLASFFTFDISSPQSVKAVLSRKFNDLNNIVLWYALMTRSDQILLVIQETFSLLFKLKVKNPVWLIRFSTMAVLASPIVCWLGAVLPFSEMECMSMMKYYSLTNTSLTFGKNCLGIFPVMLVHSYSVQNLQISVVAVYTIICFIIRRLLNVNSDRAMRAITKNNPLMRQQDVKRYFDTYDKIINTLKSIENVMRFPIFLVHINDLVNMFEGFVQMDPFNTGSSHSMSFLIGKLVNSFYSLLSFLWVSLSAASVNVADENAQDVNREVLKHVQSIGMDESILVWYTSYSHPFTLSAWGFFHFTKGFVLSAIGSVLTYSLLLISINIK